MDKATCTGVYVRDLEYVVSGTSFMRLANPHITDYPDRLEAVNKLLETMVNGHHSHSFSILFNAFTEQGYGERIAHYKDHIDQIHADSGGLQIVTQGMTITPELKNKVYETQAKYADVGMCFDEIPVVLTNDKSDRNDVKQRYFDFENYKQLATNTANNINDQLDVFENHNSKCKSFVIVQGNDYQTYMDWANIILDKVQRHDMLGGVAMAGAALGTGPKEDVKRAFIASQIPLRNEEGKLKLHVLGIGAIRRLLPYLIFSQNGLYEHVEISYDSTTHSRAVEGGMYYHNEGTIKFNRTLDQKYHTIYEDVDNFVSLDVTMEDFHKIMNWGTEKWMKEGGTYEDWILVRLKVIFMSIRNFMEHVSKVMQDKDSILAAADKIGLEKHYRNLYNVRTLDDFHHWDTNQYLGGAMKSQMVQSKKPNTLDGLFA